MIIVITGPTCTGKTKLSLVLAKEYNAEIINADSTQIFKGMDIVTAKVKDTEGIKHHLLSIKDITDEYSVFDYQKDGRKILSDKNFIIVGGTGLYIKALLYDYKFNDQSINRYENISTKELYKTLLELDPNTNIHENNRNRIVTALNYIKNNNKPFSEKKKTNKLLYDAIFIGMTTDRDILYKKINNRVDEMIKNGLLKEAKEIYDSNIRTKAVMTPIGIKELFPYFEQKKALDECLEIIKRNSRRYAKRQYTWFNNQMNIHWIKTDYDNFNNTIKEAKEYIGEL